MVSDLCVLHSLIAFVTRCLSSGQKTRIHAIVRPSIPGADEGFSFFLVIQLNVLVLFAPPFGPAYRRGSFFCRRCRVLFAHEEFFKVFWGTFDIDLLAKNVLIEIFHFCS